MEGLQSQQDSLGMECQICLNEYSWRRRAKLLACRHTCCSACLGRMVTVRHNELDRDQREMVTGPDSNREQQRHASQRHTPVNGVENGQGDRRRHRRPVTLRYNERHAELERGQIDTAFRPSTDMERRRGSQSQTAVSGMASGQQRDDRMIAQITQLGHSERHNELERDQRGAVIRPSDSSAKVEQNRPQRWTGVDGTESGQRENRMVTQLTHSGTERDQRGATAVRPCSNMENNPRRQMGVNNVETRERDTMMPRHGEPDSGHHRQRDAIHQREALVGNNPLEIINAYDTGIGGMARGQTEILSSQREMRTIDQSETSTSQNDTTTIWNEMRLTDPSEMMMSDANDIGTIQNEWRTNLNDIWLGQEDTHSTYQRVIVCPWCRGVTVLPDGLSVNHLPDDQDKMAAVTTTTPPLTHEYTPVFIRLLPSASSYLIPWSIDRDGNQETDGVMMPSSTHYLLPVYMERDNGMRDSVILSNARHYLLSAVGAVYFDRGGNVEDAGEATVGQRCLFPWPARGQRRSLPGTRDSSGMGEVWREGERVDLRVEQGLTERGRDQEAERRSSTLWTRVCTVIVLGLFVFLLVCIILHSVACPSKSFTMITCG